MVGQVQEPTVETVTSMHSSSTTDLERDSDGIQSSSNITIRSEVEASASKDQKASFSSSIS